MDQNGNPTKTVSEMLKEFADTERAQGKAEAEAKRLGLPSPSLQAKKAAEPPQTPQMMGSVPSSGDEVKPDEALLSSSQAAHLLGYSEKSFRNLVSKGKIPHYKLLGQNRFKKIELLSLLVKVESK